MSRIIDCTIVKGEQLLKSLELFINDKIRNNFDDILSEVSRLTNKTFNNENRKTSTENSKEDFVHKV